MRFFVRRTEDCFYNLPQYFKLMNLEYILLDADPLLSNAEVATQIFKTFPDQKVFVMNQNEFFSGHLPKLICSPTSNDILSISFPKIIYQYSSDEHSRRLISGHPNSKEVSPGFLWDSRNVKDVLPLVYEEHYFNKNGTTKATTSDCRFLIFKFKK